jgi:RNA polymerase-associated protein
VLTLYDAARCPYCARVRIVLAEKSIPHDAVQIDLDDRPAFIRELNPPSGRVPVLEESAFVLPESAVIMEYLEERFPEPPLMPADPAERAAARLAVERFPELGDPYYDLYFGRPAGSVERVEAALAALDRRLQATPFLAGRDYSVADIAYLPWVLRVETRLGIGLSPFVSLSAWLDRLLERPAVASEREVVASL